MYSVYRTTRGLSHKPRTAPMSVPIRQTVMILSGHAPQCDQSDAHSLSALDAALAVLAQARGKKVLVLGDMTELGDDATIWHERAGRSTRLAGVDRPFAIRDLSRHADVTVLIKGSRRMRMEALVDDIISKPSRKEEPVSQ